MWAINNQFTTNSIQYFQWILDRQIIKKYIHTNKQINMMDQNIEPIFEKNITEQSLNDIKMLFGIDTKIKRDLKITLESIELKIFDQLSHRPRLKKNKNPNRKFNNSNQLKSDCIKERASISQCSGIKVDSKTTKGTFNKIIYQQKLGQVQQKLPQIYMNYGIAFKEQTLLSVASSSKYNKNKCEQSLSIQKQNQLRNSKKNIENVLPLIEEKKLEPTSHSENLLSEKESPSPVPSEIQCKITYLINDPECHAYFKNNIENLLKQPTVNKPVPYLTANHYCIINLDTMEFVLSKSKYNEQIQIASLTKIVTAFLAILICRKFLIDMKTFRCRVSDEAVQMFGTSAQLQVGDCLTLQSLLYGLMLPSGNDAAVTIAENLGKFLQKQKKKPSRISPLKTFIRHMNILYKQMLLQQDQTEHIFQNPSGLSLNPNKTTIYQISIAAAVAMKNPIFRQIVSTKEYELTIKNERYGLSRKILWKNTNKLLWKDWEGVKTGTTQTAGHCFIGKYKNYLISVVDCATLAKRFNEAVILSNWLNDETDSPQLNS